MSLENETKQMESPLEKAKRLRAEKEAKDQANAEAEAEKQAAAQAKTEKLGTLNSHKQDLENQLNEVDVKIEASKDEAHETRDTMQEAGLDKDSEFKGEYNSTISEVAGNLNELRNRRNEIKTKLEQINLEIENFGVNEAVSEGKKETQAAISSADQENEEAISQVKNYPGAEPGDIKTAEEVAAETSGKINQTVENSEKTVNSELINKTSNEETLKTSETEQKSNEISEKASNLYQKGVIKIETFYNKQIENCEEAISNAEKLIQKSANESDLDKLIYLFSYADDGFERTENKLSGNMPYRNGSTKKEFSDFDTKVFDEYKIGMENLNDESQKNNIKAPEEKRFTPLTQELFNKLVYLDKENGPLLNKLKESEEATKEKIKKIALEFMDNEIGNLDNLKQECLNMPEQKKLIDLKDQLQTLEEKKTGIFFSENKKREQENQLRDNISETKNTIDTSRGKIKDEAGKRISEFTDKFKFNESFLDEKKVHSVFGKINSI